MSNDLQKLTLPRLKALCKEKGITGYSKLSKPALVEKLAACGQSGPVGGGVPSTASAASTTIQKANNKKRTTKAAAVAPPTDTPITVPLAFQLVVQPEHLTIRNIAQNGTSTPEAIPSIHVGHGQPVNHTRSPRITTKNNTRKKVPQENPTPELLQIVPPGTTEQYQYVTDVPAQGPMQEGQSTASVQGSSSFSLVRGTTGSARPPPSAPANETSEPPLKKQKSKHVQDGEPIQSQQSSQISLGKIRSSAQKTVIQPVNKEKTAHIPRGKTSTAKRYIPLVIRPRATTVLHTSTPTPPALADSITRRVPSAVQKSLSTGIFDIPSPRDESALSFEVITLPPSLSQRKFATKLAIILRDIRVEDLPSLALTSRLFRYSAYLSAAGHLKRWYSGERLNRIFGMKGISVDRMNLWGYRRYREREVAERMRVIRAGKGGDGTVLGKLIGGDVGIMEDVIWRRDNVRDLIVALRFLLTRCYFCVSLNQDLGEARRERIVDVNEVVKSEIWCITTERRDGSGRFSKYYVLDATCEVIGSPVGLDGTLPTRADWSVYIKRYVATSGAGRDLGIMEHVRWTNHEEYDRGISKIWLRRTQEEGEVGQMKREIARRYILACTMENSLSGRYMNSSEMEKELNGLPRKMVTCPQTREGRVNLFVPAHHHVESVEFTTGSKRLLHQGLAVVQTPSREYIILRDNGMQIGCEEEGVGEVWMDILGCSATGEAKM